MEESSNVSSVDTSGVERNPEAISPCNVINATTTTTPRDQPEMFSPQCPSMPVPIPSPDFRDLALLYWKYPTVHQTFVVSPGFHTNQVLIAKAKRKSEKLKRELTKEPERHRVDPVPHHGVSSSNKKSFKFTPEINKTGGRKSKAVVAETAPVQQRRRTVNMSTVGSPPIQQRRRTVNMSIVGPPPVQQRRRTVNMSVVGQTNQNVNVNRRLTVQPANRNRKSAEENEQSDPGAALAEFRASKGISKAISNENKFPVYSETPVVLDALREQREDLEKREEEKILSSNFLSKLNQKCCGVFRQCHYRVNCVALFILVVIIIILCISAIVYPIVKATMESKISKSK